MKAETETVKITEKKETADKNEEDGETNCSSGDTNDDVMAEKISEEKPCEENMRKRNSDSSLNFGRAKRSKLLDG